jgi:Fe/S biogenesis protein NfuA
MGPFALRGPGGTIPCMSDRQVLSLSDEAIEMIVSLRDQEEGDAEFGLLVEVTGIRGGQFQYELSFAPVADHDVGYRVERHGDLALIFPERDVEKLEGASLALTDQGLAMNNPNSPASPMLGAEPKGTLEGPLADRVAQVLAEQVNPAIAMHGGAAELVSVDESVAYLRLTGGCQGCGLAQVTLKQGIERILLETIEELTAVVDVTDHASGSDPYYQSSKK